MPPWMVKPDVCQAKDYENNRRITHKPEVAMHNAEICISCVWCGKILKEI